MESYTVRVIAEGRSQRLLVVLSPSQLCSALVDSVRSQLPTLTTSLQLSDTKDYQISLHFTAEDGPRLNMEDLLSDTLPDPREVVYAVVDGIAPEQVSSQLTLTHRSKSSETTLRIRVVTPELAQSDINAIAPLPSRVPISYTLNQLKGLVEEHLGNSTEDGECPDLACNCSLARKIDSDAVLNVQDIGDWDVLQNVIIVHSNNNVVAIPVKDLALSTIQQATRDHLHGMNLDNKFLNALGGVEDTSVRQTGGKQYIKAPVMALCSKQCRTHRQGQQFRDTHNPPAWRAKTIDIHLSECPLEITAHNSDVTLEAAKLDDCAMNGILDIYAVQRWTQDPTDGVNQGKSGIFSYSAAWKHPFDQTDRGISDLLSTLRVFSDLTSSIIMDDERQDAILHMIDLLTHFPPAVRAAYILMRGENPRLCERAALAQCLYEALKKIVPLQIIKSDRMRLFEGSRILFGLILEKAKNMKLSKLSKIGDYSKLLYLSMPVYDMQNMTTMMPVLSLPVQTTTGLVAIGYHHAFDEGALLKWTNSQSSVKVSIVDQRWNRVATLSGGTTMQVVAFNADAVRSGQRYADGGDISKIISVAEYSDLTYLANLCSRNGLTVVAPAELPSADAPVLTLDREGSLAVYVGREGCGSPGSNILMFRPTMKNETEAVDVSIITVLLEPILTERTANGTIVSKLMEATIEA
ncbi:hypothetical protein PtrSN002B_006033 [Pyrenophora tritici-repentis]|uniref:Uncharacterized protein n=2 Tax=Pyrenophora tritici-repentis TaxID=45151 RepID=A0A2W1HYQ5_9PLEO|nr:hypothetical protein PtrV1_01582 [Pyrenophora tritici-repentis]KAF7454316.1 hypothetical protein A1F99_015740 [Pyrenophora tritici-repentis]KAG9388063.1 hypothetical protein A1F94_000955 [Pyrenophora tritici-repentis]KAI0576784.1 hypothetical protein Alg215_07293 [Pyrenophora tritici-repentis]KAI0583266.1 hypothetical protein Alg130_05765 [Pyrenophora tritici-repentis]